MNITHPEDPIHLIEELETDHGLDPILALEYHILDLEGRILDPVLDRVLDLEQENDQETEDQDHTTIDQDLEVHVLDLGQNLPESLWVRQNMKIREVDLYQEIKKEVRVEHQDLKIERGKGLQNVQELKKTVKQKN